MEKYDSTPDSQASAKSIVEDFSIEGLYGYRNISLSSKYAATILIAKNGSGKTTLLAALDAFLKGQFLRLSSLDFTTISCKLAGEPNALIVSKADIQALADIANEGFMLASAKAFGLNPADLNDYIQNEFQFRNRLTKDLLSNPVFRTIYQKLSYRVGEARSQCEQISKLVREKLPQFEELRNKLSVVLSGVQIVYLPTYRRIELPLSDKRTDDTSDQPSIQARLGLTRNSLFANTIQFGLADISDRLKKLNSEIIFTSDRGYRKISANIINELIDGALDYEQIVDAPMPSREALETFFSRLKQVDGRSAHGSPFEVAIPDIEKIYSGGDEIPAKSNYFLKYFLGKLNEVVDSTQNIELMVEEFITNCNRYLNSTDSSTEFEDDDPGSKSTAYDDKVLTLNLRNFQVNVLSLYTGNQVPLESLSSGEKQMISLFASLYLYPEKKIVLIDEPELSLSLGWQRRILLDIVNSPSCVQTIAITHSPFVFDNTLEPFARTLQLELEEVKHDDLFPEDGAESIFPEEESHDE